MDESVFSNAPLTIFLENLTIFHKFNRIPKRITNRAAYKAASVSINLFQVKHLFLIMIYSLYGFSTP